MSDAIVGQRTVHCRDHAGKVTLRPRQVPARDRNGRIARKLLVALRQVIASHIEGGPSYARKVGKSGAPPPRAAAEPAAAAAPAGKSRSPFPKEATP